MSHTLAICFTNFGPYHIARLEALGTALAEQGGHLLAYEMAGTEEKYPWSITGPELSSHVRHFRLFPGRSLESLTARECRQAIASRLDQDQPTAIGAVGYVRPESLEMLRWAKSNKALRLLLSESQRIDHPRTWWKEAIKSRRVRQFQAGVVGGETHRDYLVELGLPLDRIHLGYNAVGNQDIESLLQTVVGRNLTSESPYFLTVCRFAPEKNLKALLVAYADYVKSVDGSQPWRLVMAGDGPLKPQLQQQARDLGVAELIDWPGFMAIEQLVPWYAGCGLFILPSLSEPWGLVVNEAAVCGAPLLISDRCGSAGTFVPKSGLPGGRTFDPTDSGDLAKMMRQMAGLSTTARQLMGESAKSIASQWGPDQFGKAVLAALESAREASPCLSSRSWR